MAPKPKAPKLTEDNKIILRKNGGDHMSSALAYAIMEETKKEEKDFVWKQRIKPSNISLNACLEEFQATCHLYKKWSLALKLKFMYGNAIHHWIGAFLASKYPNSYFEPNIPAHVEGWYKQAWPEVPFNSSKWKTRALMDYPARIKGKPVVIDWKTTWMDDKAWDKFCADPYVKPEYVAQGASYVFLAIEENYFPVPPEQFGFVFINMKVDPEDRTMWKEVYFDYAPYASQIRTLWELHVEALEAKLAGNFVPCKNDFCKTHGKAKPKLTIEPLNPWSPQTPSIIRENNLEIIRTNTFLDRARNFNQDFLEAEDFDSY